MSIIKLIATTTFGLESVVKREVHNLGYEQVEVENGKITFEADWSAIPRANLWLRSADRVKWQVGSFDAVTFEDLFEQTKAVPWADILPRNAAFPVVGKSVKSKLFSVSDCQAITKKAIVEKMKETYAADWFEEDGPAYKIEVALLKDRVTLSIDTSGEALHKRGYRYYHTAAPLKETMAAGLIQLSRWHPDRPFMDPFCGSGTLPIEAALLARNSAPGLNRSFASQYWPNIPQKAWDDAIEEALSLEKTARPLKVFGSDVHQEAVQLARHNADQAGVGDSVSFKQISVQDLRPDLEYGYLVCNPPYGERLGEKREAEKLYRQLGELIKQYWQTWSVYVFAAHPHFETLFDRPSTKKRKLYSGNIRCDFYQYFGPKPPRA